MENSSLRERGGPIASRRRAHPPLTNFFEAHDIPYRVVEPERPPGEGPGNRSAPAPPRNVCRGVLLRIENGWRVAVIPSDRDLDIDKAREALGEPRLRFASEPERTSLFPEFASGSLPPIGPHYSRPDLVDRRLVEHAELLWMGDGPGRALAIETSSLIRLARPVVADVCGAP